jgi:hypothetical protein
MGMPGVQAAALTGAKITHIVKDVRTVDPGKTTRKAFVNEVVDGRTSVRTGMESRTELLFNDQTITRIGANSRFSFSDGTRELALSKGVMLLQVPKGAGGATIQTSAITAGITGTTILLEVSRLFTKFIVLEAKHDCFLIAKGDPLRRKVFMKPGQEVVVRNTDRRIPAPFNIDLATLVGTSRLITGVWGAQLDQRRIAAIIAAQRGQRSVESNIALFGPGTRPVFLRGAPGQGVIQVPIPVRTTPTPVTTPTTPTTVGGNAANPGNPGNPGSPIIP